MFTKVFFCFSLGPWTIYLKFNTSLIHSTPFLNIVTNDIGLRSSYDMFGMPPILEVLGHNSEIYSSIMSKTDLSSVHIRSLYERRQGTKISQSWSHFSIFQKFLSNHAYAAELQNSFKEVMETYCPKYVCECLPLYCPFFQRFSVQYSIPLVAAMRIV